MFNNLYSVTVTARAEMPDGKGIRRKQEFKVVANDKFWAQKKVTEFIKIHMFRDFENVTMEFEIAEIFEDILT